MGMASGIHTKAYRACGLGLPFPWFASQRPLSGLPTPQGDFAWASELVLGVVFMLFLFGRSWWIFFISDGLSSHVYAWHGKAKHFNAL